MKTTLKRVLIISCLTVLCVLLIASLLMAIVSWSLFGKDQHIAKNDPVGKEFWAIYPGAYNYEYTTDSVIVLNTVSGDTIIELMIPRNGDRSQYTLRCYRPRRHKEDTEYFMMTGISDEMISAIQQETCFSKYEDHPSLKN